MKMLDDSLMEQNPVSQMFVGFAEGTRKTVEAASFLLLRVLRTESLVVISVGSGTSMRGNDSAVFFHCLRNSCVLVCCFVCFVWLL